MKSKLVIDLVVAHCSGDEDLFEKALNNLSNDEEKKGNLLLSTSLKKAYNLQNSTRKIEKNIQKSNSFDSQSMAFLPKDKDSTLDLIEIINPTISFNDVALTDKTLEALSQVITERKMTDQLLQKGISPTNRLLFCGPPGCGKTLTAKAIAGEMGLPIAYVKLDGLVSSYLGQTGTNIRKIFDYVKDKDVVLFLDEFDAIAKKRDDSNELGELKRVVTTLLQNLDEMPSNVFLIAATNHQHMLDPAIWRRFNLAVLLELPNVTQRKKIIENKLENVSIFSKKQIEMLIKLTEGMNGSQIVTFIESLIRHSILNKLVNNFESKDIANIWLNHTSLFLSEESDAYIVALKSLNYNGISMRDIEKISGIPKSTLGYKFKKIEEASINDERKETSLLDS